ncbi:MAG: GNAT family N-acetyltransferase [Lachnospiraceae bacterium]|nr:GNAT family N-acetyltransferase [Candidatus Colinaster scatohippi]
MTIVIDIEEKVNRNMVNPIDLSQLIIKNGGGLPLDGRQALHDNFTIRELFKLHVTDDITLAHSLLDSGLLVVPVINERNSDKDFSKFKYLITNPEELDDNYYIKIWQRFMGLPWHILNTERCIIREMSASDVKDLYEVYADSSITRFTEPLFPDYEDELEYTKNYIDNVYSYFGFGTWVIECRETGHIIGRAGFNYRPGYDEPELGYVIAVPYQNQGYAYEVCSAIIPYMKEEFDIDRISAFSSEENEPSLRLLNKLGFVAQTEAENIIIDSAGKDIILRRFLLEL